MIKTKNFNLGDFVKVVREDSMFVLPVGYLAKIIQCDPYGSYTIKVVDTDYWYKGEPIGKLYFDDIVVDYLEPSIATGKVSFHVSRKQAQALAKLIHYIQKSDSFNIEEMKRISRALNGSQLRKELKEKFDLSTEEN